MVRSPAGRFILFTSLSLTRAAHAGTMSVSPLATPQLVPVDVGSTTHTNYVVSNTGTTPLVIRSVSISGDAQFSVSTVPLPATVGAGDHIDVDVKFTPQATSGLLKAQLTIISNDPYSPVATPLIEGCAGPGLLAFDPPSYDFGAVYSPQAGHIHPRNVGCAPVMLTAFAVEEPFSVSPDSFLLPPFDGDEVFFADQISVGFTPAANGEVASDLTYVSDAANAAPIHLTGAKTNGYLSPQAPFVTQNVAVQRAGSPIPFSLTNDSTTPVTINEITGTNPALSLFSGPALPVTVAPGATLSFEAVCTPTHLGDNSGWIEILTSAQRSEFDMYCRGVAPLVIDIDEHMHVSPVGVSYEHSVYLANQGAYPITVSSMALSGLDVDDVVLDPMFTTPFTLAPGEERSTRRGISFTPSQNVGETAELTIKSNDATTPITKLLLRGGGYNALIRFDKSALDFGTIAEGVESEITLVATNEGPDRAELRFDNEEPFRIHAGTSGTFLAPGATETIVVSVTPSILGSLTSSLVFHTSDPPVVIPISADVVPSATALSFDTSDAVLDLGAWPLDVTSDPIVVMLKNGSDQPVPIRRIGATNLAFLVDYDGTQISDVLDAGAEVPMSVSFRSSQAGVFDGSLDVYLDRPDTGLQLGAPSLTIALHAEATSGGGGCSVSEGDHAWWVLGLCAIRRRKSRRK